MTVRAYNAETIYFKQPSQKRNWHTVNVIILSHVRPLVNKSKNNCFTSALCLAQPVRFKRFRQKLHFSTEKTQNLHNGQFFRVLLHNTVKHDIIF
nr:MAG TPA: hypothetical protein [Caudoviricetes sp.]